MVIQHSELLPWSAQIFGLLVSLFYSFLYNTRLFSLGHELPQRTISLISSRIPLSLGLSIINSLSLNPSPSLFLSVYITAFVLLCISSAGFEAISVHDHYQTRPEEEKVRGGEKDQKKKKLRQREVKSKRWRTFGAQKLGKEPQRWRKLEADVDKKFTSFETEVLIRKEGQKLPILTFFMTPILS